MGRNFIWVTTRIYSRIFSIQYFLCDLLWIMRETEFASYADDNTHYVLGDSINDVIKSL